MRHRIQNLVNDCHKKTVSWLVQTFDVIIIPNFSGGDMGRRKQRKIGSKTVRKMMTWAHTRFRERLVSKAEEFGKQVSIVSEAYTSKTCSRCGWMHPRLGGRKVFKCGGCNLEIDRDVNGARGIFLRALLDGAIFM
jgi:putative transposase